MKLIADHLNETPLQTMKTMVATIIIIASKTARESGLPIALSYKINTFYLQEINKTTDLNTLNQLKKGAQRTFTRTHPFKISAKPFILILAILRDFSKKK